MHFLLWWSLASFFVGFLGRKRRFGFWGYSLFAFFATPLVAALALLFAAPRRVKVRPKPPMAQSAGAVLKAARAPVAPSSVRYLPIAVRLVILWMLIIAAATGVLIQFGGLDSAVAAQFATESATFARSDTVRLQDHPLVEMAVVNTERALVLLLFAWTISRVLEGVAESRMRRLGGEGASQAASRISDLERRLNDQAEELQRLRTLAAPAAAASAVNTAPPLTSHTASN